MLFIACEAEPSPNSTVKNSDPFKDYPYGKSGNFTTGKNSAGTSERTLSIAFNTTIIAPYEYSGLKQTDYPAYPKYSTSRYKDKDKEQERLAVSHLILPSTLREIHAGGFAGNFIQTVDFGANSTLTTIGDHAFANNALTGDMDIPPSVTTIGNDAFADNALTGDVTIPPSVITIGDRAFSGNVTSSRSGNQIKSLVFDQPSSVTTIGKQAFFNNKLSGELIIPASVKTIGDSAFSGNTLTIVRLPAELHTDISSAEKLTTVFGPGVTYYDLPVSAGGTGKRLPNPITIPSTKTSISYSDGYSGKAITEIIFDSPSQLTTIGRSAFYNNNLSSLNLPPSVRTIEASAFAENKLTSITITNKDISIAHGAFAHNQITSVTLPRELYTRLSTAGELDAVFGTGITYTDLQRGMLP